MRASCSLFDFVDFIFLLVVWFSPRDELTDMACIEVSSSSTSIYDTDVEQFVKGTNEISLFLFGSIVLIVSC